MGTAPVRMLSASYSEATWIDFIHHFNHRKFFWRVLQSMGHLHATKTCRALYFEGDAGFETQLEAASLAWMWQELSIGPQAHAYSSVSAMWIHHIVTADEASVLTIVRFLRTFSFKAAYLSIYARRSAQATQRCWRCWRETLMRVLVQTLMPEHCVPADVERTLLSGKGERGKEGGARAVLRVVLGEQLGEEEATRAFINALCCEVESEEACCEVEQAQQPELAATRHNDDAESMEKEKEQEQGKENASKRASKRKRRLEDMLWLCAQTLSEIALLLVRLVERRQQQHSLGGQMPMLLVFWRYLGSRTLTSDVARLAIKMLQSRSRSVAQLLSSAVANVGNKNLTFEHDRFDASFAVLCSRRNVP